MKSPSNIMLLCLAAIILPFTRASEADVDICSLPKDSGPCEAAITRYYFNTNTSRCEEFIYGGCQGNANNFASFHACDGLCGACTLPNEPGPCDDDIKRYFYNTNTGLCEQFSYGGCGGNENNFETLESCKKRCNDVTCFLQRDPGPCDETFSGYYFNTNTYQCEKFVYGGCLGNANNFDTLQKCQSRCHGYKTKRSKMN